MNKHKLMKTTSKFSLTALALVALVATGADAAISVNSATAVGVSTDNKNTSSMNLSVGGDDARSKKDLDMSVWSPTQVQSDDQLNTYAQTIAHNYSSVKAITSTDDSVAVTFERPARLFGFIPVKISEKATVVVNSEGKSTVSVTKSWWAFLASENTKAEELVSKIESKLASEGSLSTSASLSAEAKAKILSDIQVSSNTVYNTSSEVK